MRPMVWQHVLLQAMLEDDHLVLSPVEATFVENLLASATSENWHIVGGVFVGGVFVGGVFVVGVGGGDVDTRFIELVRGVLRGSLRMRTQQ